MCVRFFQIVHLGFLIFYCMSITRIFTLFAFHPDGEVKAGTEVCLPGACCLFLFSPERLWVPQCPAQRLWDSVGGLPLGWEKLMFCLSNCSEEGPCPSSLPLIQFSGKDHPLHTRVIPQEPHAHAEPAKLSFPTIPVLLSFPTCLC